MASTHRRTVMLAIVGVVCLLAGLFSPGGAGIRLIADATQPPHRPGKSAVYTSLPEDQRWVNPDGQATDDPHPCAGRDLLYKAHIDAGYVTRNAEGALDVMVVNFANVEPMDQSCMRIPPESYQGKEVSRFVVPDDPNLSFLGAPGSIVWRAPFENYGGQWLPVWAGLGAFDAHHEWEVPNDFVSNSVDLTLADFDGPGEMNIYNYVSSWDRAKRIISSRDLRTTSLDVGGHGHMNWTFSEPGVYRLVWQAQGRHYDGSIERSKPVEQIWLVGEDGQVGLAPGTTKETNGYGITAEEQREEMGLSEPTEEVADPEVQDHASEISAEDAASLVEQAYKSDAGAPISSGDVNLELEYDKANNTVTRRTTRDGEELDNAVIIEVPDNGGRCVDPDDPVLGSLARAAGTRFFWSTGERGGDTPSFSVDTSKLNKEDLNQQEVMVASDVEGPAGMVYALGLGEGDSISPDATNASTRSRPVQLLGQKPHELKYLMSTPGIYSEYGTALVYGKDKSSYGWLEHRFLVGNQVINAWREKAGIDERLPENPIDCSAVTDLTGRDPFASAPGEDDSTTPGDGNEDSEPEVPGDGGDGEETSTPDTTTSEPSEEETSTEEPEPSTSNPEPTAPGDADNGEDSGDTGDNPGADEGTDDEENSDTSDLHRIEAGHLDFALGTIDGQGVAYVRDDSDPTSPVRRDSGTVAIVVPDRAWHDAAKTKHIDGFGEGAYVLPEVQNRHLPWPGLSNESFDFAGVDPDNQTTTFRIADVLAAPEGGRMMMGATENMKLVNQLDTDDLSKALVLNPRTHAHKVFLFNKPGVYEIEYEYSWYDSTGEVQRTPLVVTFEVDAEKAAEGTEPPTAPGDNEDGEETSETTSTTPTTSAKTAPKPVPKPKPTPTTTSKPAPKPSKPAPKPTKPAPKPAPKPGEDADEHGSNEGKESPKAPGTGKGDAPKDKGNATSKPGKKPDVHAVSTPNNTSRGYVPPAGKSGSGATLAAPVRGAGSAAPAPARAALPAPGAKGTPAKGGAAKGTPPKAKGTPAKGKPTPPHAKDSKSRVMPPSDPRTMDQQPGIKKNIAATSATSEFWRGLMLGIGGLSILAALFLFAHTLGRKSAAAASEDDEDTTNNGGNNPINNSW
ncbi:hypothetical protein CCICO_00565 [Corynebacterium ciconiae DSM 44920]|uniref:choice-of-anchor M domain-containing protein n=1 Tax=Corynebacterium ciconiae TaxID=227319 RepID=UPI0003A94F3D|nr:choice-of-anchor M domain-containing protein [Corynebacterium ciconiae]WKD60173.1 hypothetical protein CCICO_00565 [Corynebacterium ciconiae DSM 44920]